MKSLYPELDNFFNDSKYVQQEIFDIKKRQTNLYFIDKISQKRLNQIIKFCIKHVPYYKQSFKIVHENILSDPKPSMLKNLPFLSKENIRDNFIDMCSDHITEIPIFKHHTSGTTGIPIQIISDPLARNYNWGLVAIRLERLGVLLDGLNDSTNFVLISDATLEWNGNLPFGNFPSLTKINFREDMSVHKKTKIINLLNQLNASIIFGKPTALLYLTKYMKMKNLKIPSPNLMILSGEVLRSETRNLLEDFFCTKVYNQYSLTEAGHVACECKLKNGLHFESDRILIEIVRDDVVVPNGNVGEIVITDLTNYAMPIIRYKTGDFGKIHKNKCTCGVLYPKLELTKCRTIYYFQKEDGTLYNPSPMSKNFTSLNLKQYQLIQHTSQKFEFKYVKNNVDLDIAAVKKIIKHMCGNVMIILTEVDHIDSTTNSFISNFSDPYLIE